MNREDWDKDIWLKARTRMRWAIDCNNQRGPRVFVTYHLHSFDSSSTTPDDLRT